MVQFPADMESDLLQSDADANKFLVSLVSLPSVLKEWRLDRWRQVH